MGNRLGEIVFGAIGAGFGLTGSIFALLIHYHNLFLEPRIALGLSIIGLIGAFMLMVRRVLGSVLMVLAGIGGIICIHQLFGVAGTLLIVVGLLSFFSKPTSSNNALAQ